MHDHLEHATPEEKRDEAVEQHNARLGLYLFFLYLLVYGICVIINAFAPSWMDSIFGGLNLAVIYGLGLIIGAFILSLIYALLCKSPKKERA